MQIMIDLETLGRSAGCAILSIGAVAFDPVASNRTGPEFYSVVRLGSCHAAGLHTDDETVAWWAQQSPAARQVLDQAKSSHDNQPLAKVLEDFNGWLNQFDGEVCVWGNGADFDNAILAAAYRACGLEPGWKFWNNRCYRTLKNFFRELPMPARHGVYHNALDDAKVQAIHAVQLLQHLKALRNG